MNKILKLAIYIVIALVVWNLCEYLYCTLFVKTAYQFSVTGSLIGPVVFGLIMWSLDGKFPNKKDKQ